MTAPEKCQKAARSETRIALKCIIDVWLHGELGDFEEFFSVGKKKKSFALNK